MGLKEFKEFVKVHNGDFIDSGFIGLYAGATTIINPVIGVASTLFAIGVVGFYTYRTAQYYNSLSGEELERYKSLPSKQRRRESNWLNLKKYTGKLSS